MTGRTITDCGPDGGCEECDVCRYLNFLEWSGAVGKPDDSTVEHNAEMAAYIAANYPNQTTPTLSDPSGIVERRARELLAREYDRQGYTLAAGYVRAGNHDDLPTVSRALRAIEAALSATTAPKLEGWQDIASADGEPLPYLVWIPGIGTCFRVRLLDVGVPESATLWHRLPAPPARRALAAQVSL